MAVFWEVLALPHAFMGRLSEGSKAAKATQIQNRASINDKQGLRLWSTLKKRALTFYRSSVVVFNTSKKHFAAWRALRHFRMSLMYFLFQFLCLCVPTSSFSSASFSPFTVILWKKCSLLLPKLDGKVIKDQSAPGSKTPTSMSRILHLVGSLMSHINKMKAINWPSLSAPLLPLVHHTSADQAPSDLRKQFTYLEPLYEIYQLNA